MYMYMYIIYSRFSMCLLSGQFEICYICVVTIMYFILQTLRAQDEILSFFKCMSMMNYVDDSCQLNVSH